MEHELGDCEDSRGPKNVGKGRRSCFMHDYKIYDIKMNTTTGKFNRSQVTRRNEFLVKSTIEFCTLHFL